MRRPILKAAVGLLILVVVAGLCWPASVGDAHCSAWRSGDVLFINGTTLRSRAVRLLHGYSADYSHVGVILVEDGVPFIVHADPARGKVVKQTWAELLQSGEICGGAVFRLSGSDERQLQNVCSSARRFVAQAAPFDNAFDQEDARELYCTELVWRVFLSEGIELRDPANLERSYILPAHLAGGGQLELAVRF